MELLERDTTLLSKKPSKPFVRLTYDAAVAIIKGEEKVEGKTTIEVLEADLIETKSQIEGLKKDIAEREALIAAGGMKKGKVNFNLNTIDKNKNLD